MNIRAAMALSTLVTGCAMPMRQVTVTQTWQQDALVMAPEAPMGFGAALPVGAASLGLGAAYTATQVRSSDDVGQQALPMSGLIRGAVAASKGVELTASGSVGSPDLDLAPLTTPIDGRKGYLGRGAVGMRMFVDLQPALIQWAWSVDVGAEATHLIRTETTLVTVRQRGHDTWTAGDSDASYFLRTSPNLRLGTALRAPLPGGVWMVGGAQVQSWPRYWATRTQVDTCTTYLGGSEECTTEGDVTVPPSRLIAVLQPTLGATIPVGPLSLQVQAYANLGTTGVDTVPWGGMVMLEHVIR